MNRISMLGLAALAAGRLAAQQPAHPMMDDPMAMQEMMGPMMQVMLYTPQHLLARKDALGLTTDQVGRLTTLRSATQAAQDAAMGEAKAHMQELEQAANSATPDTSVLKTHFHAGHAAMGKAHWLALASAVQAPAIPHAAQSAQLHARGHSLQTRVHHPPPV